MNPPPVPDNPFQPPAVAESLVSPPGARPDALTRMMLPVGRSGWAIAAGYLALFAVLISLVPTLCVGMPRRRSASSLQSPIVRTVNRFLYS